MSDTSLRRVGGAPDYRELVSASLCDNATLSGRSSSKSTNRPLRIFSTAFAGIRGRAGDRMKGCSPRLLNGMAYSEAKEYTLRWCCPSRCCEPFGLAWGLGALVLNMWRWYEHMLSGLQVCSFCARLNDKCSAVVLPLMSAAGSLPVVSTLRAWGCFSHSTMSTLAHAHFSCMQARGLAPLINLI